MACSTAFTTLGRAQARALGVAELPLLTIPHPFGTCSFDEVRAIAESCMEQLLDRVTRGELKGGDG